MKKFLLVRSPMRISFVGGGTDFPDYYKKFTGCVFSATINKYVYIILNQYHDRKRCLLKYSKTENVNKLNEIKHPLIKNSLKLFNLWGLDINSVADIPSGTGLGSSSSFTVGLVNALRLLKNLKLSKGNIAEIASKIEIELAKSPIGKQDQYASSFGGCNKFIFNKNNDVSRVNYNNKIDLKLFRRNLLIFNTGIKEKNFNILSEQKKNIKKGGLYINNLHLIKKSVKIFIDGLLNNDYQTCGDILDQTWQYKKELSSSKYNKKFDEIYKISLENGAYGGKILGAGGRGYMLLLVPKNKQNKIIQKLSRLEVLNFKFEFDGVSTLLTTD